MKTIEGEFQIMKHGTMFVGDTEVKGTDTVTLTVNQIKKIIKDAKAQVI